MKENDLQMIQELTNDFAPDIAKMNQDLWSYAEPGYKEFKSCSELTAALEKEGFAVEKGIAGIPTAFKAVYGSGRPVIGITAEYDALPNLSQEKGVAEQKPLAGNSFGHGCGHCALGAGAAGAAVLAGKWLKKAGVAGTIVLFGTPAEETGYGKAFMARAHVFDGLDMMFTWHPANVNAAMAVRCNAYLVVRFNFKGVSSHAAAAPELGRSALDACELMNSGVNYLREHIIQQARVHYAYLEVGGKAPNVVQSHASLLYFVRAPKVSQCREILSRVNDCAKGAALMTGTTVTMKIVGGLSDLIPNFTAQQILSDAFTEAGAAEYDAEDYAVAEKFLAILPEDQKKACIRQGAALNGVSEEEFARKPLATGIVPFDKNKVLSFPASTDVGDVSYIVPTAQINVATCIPGTSMHTWQHTAMVGTGIGDKASAAAARAIAYACTKVFRAPEVCETARKELLAETGGVYDCPIPDDITPKDTVTD